MQGREKNFPKQSWWHKKALFRNILDRLTKFTFTDIKLLEIIEIEAAR